MIDSCEPVYMLSSEFAIHNTEILILAICLVLSTTSTLPVIDNIQKLRLDVWGQSSHLPRTGQDESFDGFDGTHWSSR